MQAPPWSAALAVTPVLSPHAVNLSAATSPSADSGAWIYEVQPSADLPTLDLSVTLKSRILHPSLLRTFDRLVSFHRVNLVGYIITTLMYVLALTTPPRVGQPLGVLGLLTGLSGTVNMLGNLRSDPIKTLLRTYDIIFFGTTVFITLVVFMAMIRDARALVVLQSLIAFQINIFTDANIEALRRIAAVNVFAMICTMFVALCATLDLTPSLHNFIIIAFGSHRLEARDVVTNGFVTVLAIMLRNTYRKRALLLRRSKGSVVDCVSYRCSLLLVLRTSDGQPSPAMSTRQFTSALSHIQAMRYVACLPLIDAKRILIPRFFIWLTKPSQAQAKRVVFFWIGFLGAVIAATTAFYDFIHFKIATGSGTDSMGLQEDITHSSNALLLALVLTCLYTGCCLALCQRDLLVAIVSSFDFLFLSSQLTFVHLAVADFFSWRRSCVLLLITWLWSHWVFTVDALTPVVRNCIGYSSLFLKIVVTALVLSTSVLNHLLLFSEATVRINDRVFWSGQIFGEHVEFHMLATFYSTFVTVMAWALRLFWRVFSARTHGFVMLDGPVAYDNYLRPPSKPPRQSKRATLAKLYARVRSRGSISPNREQS